MEHTNYVYQLCMDIETDVRWLIQQAMTSQRQQEVHRLPSNVKEILRHLQHAGEQCEHAVERRSILSELKAQLRNVMTLDHAPNSGHSPMVLYGEAGVGKSTIMAQLHQRLAQWFGSDCVRVTRFAALTSKSMNLYDLLLSVCEQIAAVYGIHLPRDLDQKPMLKLAATFQKLLRKISDHPMAFQRPLFILLDSLDDLSRLYNAHNPAWLPQTCPPHVYIVVSCRAQACSLYTRLRTLLKVTDSFIKVEGFSPTSAAKYVDAYLSSHGRTLTSEQRQTLLNMSHGAGHSPMYMSLLLSQAKAWDSLFAPSELQLGKTISAAIAHVFDSLCDKHGRNFVAFTFAYITMSKGQL